MADWPADQYIGPIVSTEHVYSWGGHMYHDTLNTLSSATNSSANDARFIPFTIPCPFLVRAMFYNGTAVVGNIDLGVFGLDGTLILSTGAVAQAGTSTLQIISVTETLLSPGSYYFACSPSSGSGTWFRHSYGGAGQVCGGLLKSSGAGNHPLQNNPTVVNTASIVIPCMGMASITSF